MFYEEEDTMNEKKLYKSSRNRKLSGVCGGIGEYLEIDPTLVRLAWVAFTLMGGAGILAYVIAAIIISEEPGYYPTDTNNQ